MNWSAAGFSAAWPRTSTSPRLVHPLVLALFHKRIEGDDALLQLARQRFQEAGLGTEMHAASPEELEWLLGFRPAPDTPVIVHLPREINLFHEEHRRLIEDFSTRFAGRVLGYVIHDQAEMATDCEGYGRAARELESRLLRIKDGPFLFIEYAVGLPPDLFLRWFHSLGDLQRISVCVDVGHLGLWHVRQTYGQRFPGQDVCALDPADPHPPPWLAEIDRAVSSALPAVVNFIRALGRPNKPIHFHVHDGHPLSKLSPFCVSDHLSFLSAIPLGSPPHEPGGIMCRGPQIVGRRHADPPEEVHGPQAHPILGLGAFQGSWSLRPMFGPQGLADMVAAALQTIGADQLSFTLEIHPVGDRLPLEETAGLFRHWQDKTNAEKMNHWLAVLAENHRLLSQIIRRVKTDIVDLIDLQDEDDVQPKY